MPNQPIRTEADHTDKPVVICPYCGAIPTNTHVLTGETTSIGCVECKRLFDCEAEVRVFYTTTRLEDVECEPYLGSAPYCEGCGGRNVAFERSSGFAGYRCAACGHWSFQGDALRGVSNA